MNYPLFQLESVTSIDEQIDLNPYITAESDIISFDETKVAGKLYYDGHTAKFIINIETKITQACAITLLPVSYDLSFDTEIIYSDTLEDYDYILEDPIDLDPIIYAYIMTEKPITVFHASADRDAFTEKNDPHPAFEALKTLKKN